MKQEDINQFIRRINQLIQIKDKAFPRFEFDNIYSLSEVEKLTEPKKRRITQNEYLTINFDFRTILKESSDKQQFVDRTLCKYIYPRIFLKNEKNRHGNGDLEN